MSVSSSGEVQKIVSILRDRYGEITWRPGDSDEVTRGAILTRQAIWENVTRVPQNSDRGDPGTYRGLCKRVLHKKEV